MAQLQSEEIEGLKKIVEDVQQTKPDSPIKEKDIRSAMYRKTEEITKLVDGRVIYDWDEYFMSVACLAALRSKDPRTPVRYCHYYTVK